MIFNQSIRCIRNRSPLCIFVKDCEKVHHFLSDADLRQLPNMEGATPTIIPSTKYYVSPQRVVPFNIGAFMKSPMGLMAMGMVFVSSLPCSRNPPFSSARGNLFLYRYETF